MIIEVGEFCDRVESDLAGLVDHLQELTGRFGDNERQAWMRSLPKLSIVLAKPALTPLHLHLGQSAGLALEYRLPASSSWCDAIVLGRNENKPSAVVIELKDWDVDGDKPGPREGLVERRGTLYLHPSDQVQGYVEYCRRFHSAVQQHQAEVHGCVYFTRAENADAYRAAPHDSLVQRFPVFTNGKTEATDKFADFLAGHLKHPDRKFAEKFENGTYQQDRNFLAQIAREIANPLQTMFVLLDNQRLGFELCRARVQEALRSSESRKVVIIIEGPPGSGKSVLAAKLWGEIATNPSLPKGNVVLTTTSASQGSNWEHIFKRVAKNAAGAGVVKRANTYAPATTQWFGKFNQDNPTEPMGPDKWQANLKRLREQQPKYRCDDDCYLVSIVDEAHALINPEKPAARPGVSGWPIAAGPQAYHIMRASKVTVFLMDSAQSFRDNETTSKDDIIRCAQSLGADVGEPVSLADNQFRCGGSKEYIEWLEAVLGLRELPGKEWRKSATSPTGKMIFDVVDSPVEVEARLRERIKEGHTARIVAPYARPWATRGVASPHDLPASKKDFVIRVGDDLWAKIWNYVEADGDYSLFIQAPEGTRMHTDPLCEIGCPYTVRGFDYGYLGVLWCSDLLWRSGRWTFDLDHVHEGAWKQTLSAVKKESRSKGTGGPAGDELVRRLKIAYRILLSRAIRGIYVWFEDPDTREHVLSLLPK